MVATYLNLIVWMLFNISNAFISYTKLNLAKTQAKTRQHLETEFLLFENHS